MHLCAAEDRDRLDTADGCVEPAIFATSRNRSLARTHGHKGFCIGGFRGEFRGVLTSPFLSPQKLDGLIFHTLSPIVFSFPALLLNISAASPFSGTKYWLHFLLLCCPIIIQCNAVPAIQLSNGPLATLYIVWSAGAVSLPRNFTSHDEASKWWFFAHYELFCQGSREQ